jgi:hypothetical protein
MLLLGIPVKDGMHLSPDRRFRGKVGRFV